MLGGLWLGIVTPGGVVAVDRELVAGADPLDSDELSLRAGQLRSASGLAKAAALWRGLAKTSLLLRDGLSPLYYERAQLGARSRKVPDD